MLALKFGTTGLHSFNLQFSSVFTDCNIYLWCHKTSFLSSVPVITHPNLPCSQCSVITFGVDLEDFLLSLDSYISGHKLCDTVAAQSFGFVASVGKFSLK